MLPELVVHHAHFVERPLERLLIEVFLPFELLSLRLGDWNLAIGLGESDLLGNRYRVVVRCHERTYDTSQRDQLLPAWQTRHAGLPGDEEKESSPFTGWACDDQPAAANETRFREAKASICVACSLPNGTGEQQALGSIIVAGYSVAVLVRGPECSQHGDLTALLDGGSFRKLPEREGLPGQAVPPLGLS